jgi:hypothetical protein
MFLLKDLLIFRKVGVTSLGQYVSQDLWYCFSMIVCPMASAPSHFQVCKFMKWFFCPSLNNKITATITVPSFLPLA